MLKVIIVPVGNRPYEKEIEGDLASFQAEVGGYIECVQLGAGITLVCNEKGKLIDLPPNRVIGRDVIAGNFVLTKTDYSTGDFVDLSEIEVKMLLWDFSAVVIG